MQRNTVHSLLCFFNLQSWLSEYRDSILHYLLFHHQNKVDLPKEFSRYMIWRMAKGILWVWCEFRPWFYWYRKRFTHKGLFYWYRKIFTWGSILLEVSINRLYSLPKNLKDGQKASFEYDVNFTRPWFYWYRKRFTHKGVFYWYRKIFTLKGVFYWKFLLTVCTLCRRILLDHSFTDTGILLHFRHDCYLLFLWTIFLLSSRIYC